jgi:hypothetical protein
MAKTKLLHFEILAHINESKKLMDYLQNAGIAQIENADHEELLRHKTDVTVSEYLRKSRITEKAFRILESHCNLSKNIIEKFSDWREIEYSEYKLIADKNEEIFEVCEELIEAEGKILSYKEDISKEKSNLDYFSSWQKLDIPLGSQRTMNTNIFIGSFRKKLTAEMLESILVSKDEELTDVEIENHRVKGIVVNNAERIECETLVLATGHSARDTFRMLYDTGFSMTAKPFAVGVRVQHNQDMINMSQYGHKYKDILPEASYKLTYKAKNGRGVSSFCMSPGGYVVKA